MRKYIIVSLFIVFGFITVALLRRSAPVKHEPGNIGHLGEIRTALTIFYSDANGRFPNDLNELVPKYLPMIPEVSGVKEHNPTRMVVLADELSSTDSGGWIYVNNPKSTHYGEVRIDCTHSNGQKPLFEF